MTKEKPGVGVGVIIEDSQGNILIGKRIGSHAPNWSIPGGWLKPGESFEDGSRRELEEEHGLLIKKSKIIAVTNNLETFRRDGIHNISIILLAEEYEGEPKILEANKCAEIRWCDPNNLPQPHFDASRLAIQCYLNGTFYEGIAE